MTNQKTFSQVRKFDLNSLKTKMKESAAGKKTYSDDRFWNISRDTSGNGSAVIRFLPGKVDDYELPFVKLFSHSFEGPGGWLIENCPTTLGLDCPICETNRVLYKGTDDDKKLAGTRKRKTTYISNILVISDPANPENEGKVFLFKYGTKIFEMLTYAMNPEDEDEDVINPFDLTDGGADFKLKVREVSGWPNYEKSGFAKLKALDVDADKLETIVNSQYSLADIISPDKFKSYEDLLAKFQKVTNGAAVNSTVQESLETEKQSTPESSDSDDLPWNNSQEETTSEESSDDDDLKDLEKFLGS